MQSTDGNFYGTTYGGGVTGNCGTVFKITPSGTLTTLLQLLLSSDCRTALNPMPGWCKAPTGTSTGRPLGGGANTCSGAAVRHGLQNHPKGTLTTLYSFCANRLPRRRAPTPGWCKAPTGTSTGQPTDGGANDDGTVFKITPEGTLTTLHSFALTDGTNPSRAGASHRREPLRDNRGRDNAVRLMARSSKSPRGAR